MARGRRATKKTAVAAAAVPKSPEPSPLSTRSNTPAPAEIPETAPVHSEDDTCPACSNDSTQTLNNIEKENWIRCDTCKTWYHWRCAGNGDDVDTIDKWFCEQCLKANPARTVTYKAPARKSSRKRTQRDYANLNSGIGSDVGRWMRMLEGKVFKADTFPRMKGSEVTLEWLEEDENALMEPVVIEKAEGLGMKMPGDDFTVDDVAELIGENAPLEVIDVASQSTAPGWTLGKWAEYFNLEESQRDKIWNVISLECSGTELANKILPPRLVREVDWVEKFWPGTRKGKGNPYPKVQLYCLMGVAGAWTDWHVDFAGSSVYYHILHGAKVFYFIRPTPANLAAYERWSGTDLQNHSWLGDLVDEVIKVELQQGNTMIIPTGWIHAVYTPKDTLVFGGNFLHSYNVATQLKIRQIENSTGVPKKFRFPLFSKLCWYTGEKYLRDLKNREEFSPRVLDSVDALAEFLVSEARILERGTDHAKREAKEQVPHDRVKDPSAVARELRWRVRMAAGHLSEDEDAGVYKKGGIGTKRKRGTSTAPGDTVKFRNFKPRPWDKVVESPAEAEKRTAKAEKPSPDGSWKDKWTAWKGDEMDVESNGDVVSVDHRKNIIIKIRKTAKGLERQRVERVVEEWVWGDSETSNGETGTTEEMKQESSLMDVVDGAGV